METKKYEAGDGYALLNLSGDLSLWLLLEFERCALPTFIPAVMPWLLEPVWLFCGLERLARG
jgi:hypothetical protein